MSFDPYSRSRRGYQQRTGPRPGTARRDQYGNLIPGEFSGVDSSGAGIPMGTAAREQGLHTGSLSTGAPPSGPSAFDLKFGRRQKPPTSTVTPAPKMASPALAATGALASAISPAVMAAANPLGAITAQPATTAAAVPGSAMTAAGTTPIAQAPRTVAHPDAFSTMRTNANGGTERWQPSETTGTGKWVGGTGVSPASVALPSHPDDRALLMETRARDAAARMPAPVSIPGGDPAARVWNTAHGTGHASTPEPGAVAPPAMDAFSRSIPSLQAAAGTGQVVRTAYGPVSSSVAHVASSPPQAMPTGVTSSAQMRSAASPDQVPAVSMMPPPAPPVGAPSRQSMLTGGVTAPPPTTPPAQVAPVTPTPITAPPVDPALQQIQQYKQQKNAAAQASIAPIQPPDESLRPRARKVKLSDPFALGQ